MAVLNQIRKQKVFLILIIAMALFAFVVSIPDIIKLTDKDGNKQNIVASINGKDISRTEFMSKVERVQAQQQGRATTSQIMNQVYNLEVETAVLDAQYDALNLSVEQDQMRDILKTSLATVPDFLNDAGVFDENKLNEFIANLKAISPEFGYLNGQPIDYASWVNYENSIAQNYLKQNYLNLVKAGTTATVAEGELAYKLEADKVDIKYVQVPYASIPDSTISVSKSEIKDYISKHKKEYDAEASRSINFVQFNEVASVDDEKDLKANLLDLLNDKPERENGVTTNVLGFLNTDNVEEFVNLNSDVKFNNAYLKKSDLPKAFADSIFNLPAGKTFGPYKDGAAFKISKIVSTIQLPDSVKARHILIPFIGASSASAEVTQTETQAKATADSLVSILKGNKSKFAEFVTEFSSDKGSVEKGGHYDWYPYNQMVPEFRDFTFENKVGSLGVVKTAFGFHIIEVEGQKNMQKAVKVATIARNIEASEATSDKIYRDVSNFELEVGKKDFLETAKAQNYVARPVTGIKALDENIPGIGANREIVRWAFNSDTDTGDVKRFNISGGYVVAQLTKQNEAGLMNVEDASVTALPKIRKEKKAKIIMDRNSATNLDDFAAAENQTVKNGASAINMKNPTIAGAGREPLVVGTAFGLNAGETSGLIAGENGVFMIETTKKEDAKQLDNYQAFANQVATQKQNAVNTKLLDALKEASDIMDNRAKTVQ